ncbi:hypothetical protein RyT2_07810 [Pseudolactococcus yaeyamensis]
MKVGRIMRLRYERKPVGKLRVIILWGEVPEHILENAHNGKLGIGRVVTDDYALEIRA